MQSQTTTTHRTKSVIVRRGLLTNRVRPLVVSDERVRHHGHGDERVDGAKDLGELGNKVYS